MQKHAVWSRAGRALALLGALAATVAHAQASSSVLTGNVTDAATRAPVADVVVTATSPGLQGEQVAVTDATGLYRIPQLPPGVYTLRFEKESYRPYSRPQIDVPADRTLRLNVELLPETAGTETVTVVGTPPTIDVGSSTVGSSVNQDFVRNIAVSRPGGLGGTNRSFDSLATVAPQANADVYGVGISGATSPENQYVIDGLSVNNPAYGVLGTPITSEFIDEVNVITGGYMPEYGRTTGGTVSAVTKTGGNEFHGSIFGNFSPGAWSGSPGPLAGNSGVVVGRVAPGNIGDFGATLGGYILKDKLWFFVGFQPSYSNVNYYRSFNYVAPNGDLTPIANSEQHRIGTTHSYNFIGKLTYLINADNRVSVTVLGTPTGGGGNGSFAGINTNVGGTARGAAGAAIFTGGTFNSSARRVRQDAYDVVGELNSAFLDKKLLLDVRAGWHHQQNDLLPIDGSTVADINDPTKLAGTIGIQGSNAVGDPITSIDDQLPASVKLACSQQAAAGNNSACLVTQYTYGGSGFGQTLKLDSIQAKATVTYLATALGHHVIKAGPDLEFSSYDNTTFYSGKTFLGEGATSINPDTGAYVGPARFTDLRRYGYITGPGVGDIVTQDYLQAKSKRNAIGGFVQDSWSVLDKVTVNLGLRYDSVALKGQDGVTRIALNDQWSPRVGVVWDPTQQGRSKIYANYGRYYENIPLDIADRELSSQAQISGRHYVADGCNPLGKNALASCDAATRRFAGTNFAPNAYWRVTGTREVVAVDPDLKSPSNDEIVAGGEYEILANARLGVGYTYRNLHRTVEDMSNDEANTYFIGNPGEGVANGFPKAERTYHAVTVSFNKTFSDLWLAQVSYTWSRLTGNYDGLYRPEDQQLDPNLNSTFDLKSLLTNQQGNLAGDTTHVIKAFVAKEFVILPILSATVGGSFTASSGAPINYLGAQELYGNGQAYILTRGSGGRLPWNTSTDARFAVNYRLSKENVLSVSADIFNIFNSQRPTLVDQDYTFDTVGPIVGAKNGSVPKQYGGVCTGADVGTCAQGNGSLPKPPPNATNFNVALASPGQQPVVAAVNPGWGRPLQYQAVRTFCFGVRFTF